MFRIVSILMTGIRSHCRNFRVNSMISPDIILLICVYWVYLEMKERQHEKCAIVCLIIFNEHDCMIAINLINSLSCTHTFTHIHALQFKIHSHFYYLLQVHRRHKLNCLIFVVDFGYFLSRLEYSNVQMHMHNTPYHHCCGILFLFQPYF